MRTKRNIRIVAMVLIMTFAVSFLTIGVSAQDNANWSQKISDELLDAMSTANSKEKIPVWIWFADIEQDEVEEQVKDETGLSKEDLDVDQKAANDKLAYELSSKLDDEEDQQDISELMSSYLDATQNERAEEKERTDKYIKARRNIARDMYVEKNKKNINELKLPKDEIIFQSELTSSVIVNLTKGQINRAAKSKDVVGVDLYIDEDVVEPDMCENQTLTTNTDKAQEEFGLTGEGVNVLLNDDYYVRSDAGHYSDLSNPKNIKTVVNKKLYSINNLSVMSGDKYLTHPNIVAATMQAFAPDVNIYSVRYDYYDDIEWAILYCDIDVLNVSMSFSRAAYSNNAPAKWFDALVSTHNVTVVGSGGNHYKEDEQPHASSPGAGYNCISTGAYKATGNSSEDAMFNFRYNSIDPSKGYVCYKPDMVIAANSTSEGAGSMSGVIALMLQLEPSLAAEPELIKAILMASCHRKVAVNYDNVYGISRDESMSDGLTLRQGAGAIDTYRAISIILQGNYGIGELTSKDQPQEIITIAKSDGSNVNVSLSWLIDNEYIANRFSSNSSSIVGTLQELTLEANGPKSVVSAKQNAGKQLVYLDDDCPSGNYDIIVTKTSENTEPVKFAYAWSTEDISVNHIKFSSTDYDNILSRGEVEYQLKEDGIKTVSTNDILNNEYAEMFTVSFDSSVKIIGDGALQDIANMVTVNIHNGITTISPRAFEGCSALTNVTIPASVTNIGDSAFSGCTNLCEVYLQSIKAPNIGADAFAGIAEGAIGYLESYNTGYAESYGNLTINHITDIRTIYFYDKYDWKDVNAYLWEYNTDRNNVWPGTPMDYDDVKNAYYIKVDYNKYDMLIVNDGDTGKQTINLDAGLDGVIYYLPDEIDDKYFLFNVDRDY